MRVLTPARVRSMPIDARAVKAARKHLGEGRANYKWNADVFERLKTSVPTGKVNRYDENMVRHEIMEAQLMKTGLEYEKAHQQALELLGHQQKDIIDPELLAKYRVTIGPDGKLEEL